MLAVAEGAALPPEQQLVEEVHVDAAEQLLEQLPHQEGGYLGPLQVAQQLVEDVEDGHPMLAGLSCVEAYSRCCWKTWPIYSRANDRMTSCAPVKFVRKG